MREKHFTLIIIPESTGRIRQLKCPYVLIQGLLVLGITIFLTIPTISYYLVKKYHTLQQQVSSLSQLRQETTLQRSLVSRYEQDIRDMWQSVSHLQRVNARLLAMIGIEQPLMSPFGVGGGEESQALFDKIGQDYDPEDAFSHKMEDLMTLEEDILSQQHIAQHLEEFLEDQAHVFASTPSIWPVPGEEEITSGFGMRTHPVTGERAMHWGIDIGAPEGTPIVATADGIVAFSGVKGTFGNVLVIDHGYGYTTFYGHCSKLEKKVDDRVKRGDTIAQVGSTGRSTHHHLHYEIRVNGTAKDPLQFIIGLR